MRSTLLVLALALPLVACRTEKHAPSSDVTLTSASSTPVKTPAATAAEPPPAAPTAPAPKPAAAEPEPPPPTKMAAGKPTVLEGTGLTITPAFAYTIVDRKTHWNLDDTAKALKQGDLWLMRKTFAPDGSAGHVSCKNPKEGVGKKEADGSFTYRCRADSEGNGTWVGRVIPSKDPAYPAVHCIGSSTSAKELALIDATCRSIKKQ